MLEKWLGGSFLAVFLIYLSKRRVIIVKELMLELLTYEPFEKFLPVEKIYIDDILSGNYQQPQSMLHDLFSGFYCCVQQEAFDDVDWL